MHLIDAGLVADLIKLETGHHTASLIHFDPDGWSLDESALDDLTNEKNEIMFNLHTEHYVGLFLQDGQFIHWDTF